MWSQNLDTCQVMREENVWRTRHFQEVKELEEMTKTKRSYESGEGKSHLCQMSRAPARELKELRKCVALRV